MIINRELLRKHIADEYDVNRIMNKAMTYQGVNHYCKMSPNKQGGLISAVHFKSDEWIKSQENKIANMREIYRGLNQRLLDVMNRVVKDELND